MTYNCLYTKYARIDLQTQYLLALEKDLTNLAALVVQLENNLKLLAGDLLSIQKGTSTLTPPWGIL